MSFRDDHFMTREKASITPCPVARIFHDKEDAFCIADACPVWRWRTAFADDPEFRVAIKREAAALAKAKEEATGKKQIEASYHKRAVANVTQNPKAHGIERTHGYCGFGGPVT